MATAYLAESLINQSNQLQFHAQYEHTFVSSCYGVPLDSPQTLDESVAAALCALETVLSIQTSQSTRVEGDTVIKVRRVVGPDGMTLVIRWPNGKTIHSPPTPKPRIAA